jgi:hypothetical protein
MAAAKLLSIFSPSSKLRDHPVDPGRFGWLSDQFRRFIVRIGNELVLDDSRGMAAERGLKVHRRKSLSLVNAKGQGALLWEKLGIQARLALHQSVERDLEFQPPGHFDHESSAAKAGNQSLLRSSLEQCEEGGPVEFLQRHKFATAEQRQRTPFTGLFDVDSRLSEFDDHVFHSTFADNEKAHLFSGEAASHKRNNDGMGRTRAGGDRAHVIARLQRFYLLFEGRYAEQARLYIPPF